MSTPISHSITETTFNFIPPLISRLHYKSWIRRHSSRRNSRVNETKNH